MPPTLRRIPSTGRGYVEPRLEVSQALPLHMVLIPGGSFLMGSPDDELERTQAEGPQHQVSVSKFFMGRYPVTQAQWRAVATLPKIGHELNLNPSRFEGDDLPVEQVSWYEAAEFCDRLAEHTNRPYRLPSEAEWEYACRAGTTTPFNFGDTISTDVANYNGEYRYGDSPKGENRETTTSVGQLKNSNAYGLSDMLGNVYEWSWDHWHDNYEGAPTDASAWIEGRNADRRVCRGGSWNFSPRNCRSAYRINYSPAVRYSDIGFRVSCAAPGALA
ncbi:MAG: formylglycine-generating enzyme family protein [Cyanobacteria bacterium J06555_13]